MDEQILKELKRMNNFLEAIDWKLWNFHNKFFTSTGDAVAPETSEETEFVAVSVPTYKKKHNE